MAKLKFWRLKYHPYTLKDKVSILRLGPAAALEI